MSFLEHRQLQNNIILSGIPEESWEDLKKLKTMVIEKISWASPTHSREEAIKRTTSATMTYYKRNEKYETNKTRPIAITFLNHED